MQKQFQLYTTIACLIAVSACTKVITVNLNDVAPQMVIQGNVTNVNSVIINAIKRKDFCIA